MRKIISLLIAAALLLQINIPAMAANYSSKNIEMMLAVLSETDVISINGEQEFNADKTVSRAEFSEYVAKAINIQPSFEMQYFNDVPKELERADYINALTDYGIVSLNEEKIFEPEKPIKRAEALKMLLCIMGYGDYAASKANGMDSYVAVASDVGLFINTKNPDAVTAEEAVRMIYSAMSEPMLVYNFSEKSASVDKSANIFATYHNVYFAEGVVEATYGAYLENKKMPKENKTVISGTDYDTTFDLYDFIGTTVKYVYLWDKTEDSGTVFYAEVKNEDDTFDISSDLLDGFDESSNTFYYFRDEESSRTSKQTIEKSYQIIYNGVPYNGSVETAISGFKDKTRRGSVRLVDSNRNGKFDIVVIKNYEVMPSGTISLVDESIYGGFDKQ